jgi:hypothetical protein
VTGSRQIVFSSARRAPRRRWTRVVGVSFGIVVSLVVIAGLIAGSLWLYAFARLGGDQITGLDDSVAALGGDAPAGPAGATTVLVVLTAPHDPTVPAAPEMRGPAFLVQAGGSREVPAVLVLPADLPVSIDGAPAATVAEVQQDGDVDALVAALRDYTGVRIDHAVSVSEDALPRLVELHDPEVCDAADRCRELRPEDVREAQAEGAVEQQVQDLTAALRAVATELDLAGVLTSPLATKRTVDVVSRDVRTDVSLRGTGLLDLARVLEEAPAPEVAVLPLLHNPETGRAVLLEEAETLLQRLREGASLADAESGSSGEIDPADLAGTVDVAVLNGAGIDGLAGRVEARLVAEGFRVVGTGNAPSFSDESTTSISYDPDDPAAEVAAILLAERLEGASLQAAERTPTFEGDPVGVLVIAGADLDDGGDG